MTVRLAILISGRGSNMKAILEESRDGILKGLCTVSVVVSNVCDAAGLETAREAGVDALCVPSKGKKRQAFEMELIETLEPYKPDYIVLAGFMRILTPYFINHYRNRILNIHPADTSLFQGVGGYEWAFEKKLKETKISVHFIDDGVDTGPVIAQRTVDLRGADSLEEVQNRGLKVERQFYSEVIRDVILNKEIIQ